MNGLLIFVIALALLSLLGNVYLWQRICKSQFGIDTLNKLTQDIITAKRHKAELEEATGRLSVKADELTMKLELGDVELGALAKQKYDAEEQLKSAQLLASKELELQNERLKAKAQADLDAELEDLKSKHPLTSYRGILEKLQAEIAEAKRVLSARQAEVKAAEEEEDYNAAHSLQLSPVELADITLLREFAPRIISKKDAVNKLIWTEWYQRPLQALRKSLGADKKIGIYMIEEKGTGRMYIGQAMNIGERWAEHVKAGLGIGSTAYQTNKFYKAMHAKGPENFVFKILEVCESAELNAREKYWIDFYNAVSFGFNTKTGGQ